MLGNLKRKWITQLQPDTDYSFVLMSWGNSAGGLQQQVSIRTAPDLLKMKPTQEQHEMDEGGRITLSLPRVPAGVAVRSVGFDSHIKSVYVNRIHLSRTLCVLDNPISFLYKNIPLHLSFSLRWYYIVVVPITLATLKKWENPDDMDINEVSRY